MDERVLRVLAGSNLLEFDRVIPTLITATEGNALIRAILERHKDENDRLTYISDRLDDLVVRMAHSYERCTKENELALQNWILEKLNIGEHEDRFVGKCCSIAVHFVHLDAQETLREMQAIAKLPTAIDIINSWKEAH